MESTRSTFNDDEPVDIFQQLVPDDLLNDIVFFSNVYAMQIQGHENFKLTLPELKRFIGMDFVMTYIRYARIRMYWSSQQELHQSVIVDTMSSRRFEEMRTYLYIVDNDDKPE